MQARIDSHIHLFDFLQNTEGAPDLIGALDAAGIRGGVVFGVPLVKKWDAYDPIEPRYYLDDNSRCYYYSLTDALVRDAVLGLEAGCRARLAPLICGFNPTDRHAVRHVERMLASSEPGFWRGVGEIFLRHDDLTNLTFEETARANHPAMGPVFELCESEGLPVLLHQNSTSEGRHDDYVYLHELEEVLNKHPGLTVVWAHCGISRRVFHDRYYEMVRDMLDRHPRLHVDTSWMACDAICPADGGDVADEWLNVMEAFPDRFLFGSDPLGRFSGLPDVLNRWSKLAGQLGPAARDSFFGGNASRIFFGGGAPGLIVS